MGDKQDKPDALAPWRAEIPAAIKAGGFKARFWRLALRLGRIPTLSEEFESGIRDGGWR